jgi:hypothetical protein
MDNWIAAVKKELNVTVEVDVESLLLLARNAAHSIERPAAPITTYLLGISVANGMDFNLAVQKISDLAKNWSAAQ